MYLLCYTEVSNNEKPDHMEPDILKKLEAQEEKLERIYVSVEKTRKYFLWTLVVSVAMFVLPLLGILLAVPWLLSALGSAYGI